MPNTEFADPSGSGKVHRSIDQEVTGMVSGDWKIVQVNSLDGCVVIVSSH